MFDKFLNNKIIDIYTKKFYLFSSVSNIISSIFAFFIVPGIGHYVSIFGLVMFFVMLYEGIAKTFTKEQFNNRYTIKIIYEIIITVIAFLIMPQPFLMYLPILLSLVYMNVNTVIKSKALQIISFMFMLTPLIKIYIMPSEDILMYISVCSLFIMISLLSSLIFKSNREMIKDAEKKSDILKEIFKLTHRRPIHDVRNELTKLYILSYKQYENPGDYMELLKDCSENIQRYSNTNIFDNEDEINLEMLIKDLEEFTKSPYINYCNSFIDRRTIISNANFLRSVLKTILENCIQKSLNSNAPGDVVLVKREGTLMIWDECGKSNSTAFTKFITVVQDPIVVELFKFSLNVEELEKGYKYEIKFKKYE